MSVIGLNRNSSGRMVRAALAICCALAAFSLRETVSALGEVPLPRAKVGAILPLSGSAAEQGEWIRSGLELGFEEARKKSGVDVEMIVEESQADPKLALSAYKAINSAKELPVVFSYGSGVGIALSPVVNADEVVQIGLATASPAYRSPDDYTFRNFPSAELEAEFLVATALYKLQTQEIAILRIENEYGLGSAKAFRSEFEKRGGKILLEDSLPANQTDFRPQLLRLKTLQPKLIYLAAYPAEGALVLKQAREMGISGQFLASVAILGSKNFADLAGQGAEGLLVASSSPVYAHSSDPSVSSFSSSYQARFGVAPGIQQIYAARAYDAALLTAEAVKSCGANARCIKDNLYQVREYHGASGTISFDRNGDISNTFSLQRFEEGEFSEIGQPPTETPKVPPLNGAL